MVSKIQSSTGLFKCEKTGRAAVIELQEGAFQLFLDLDARKDYLSLLSQIEEASDISGLVILNRKPFPGDEEYRRFIEKIVAVKKGTPDRREFLLTLKENSLDLFTLHAYSFKKLLVAGFDGTITAAFLGYCLAFDFRIATHDTSFEFPSGSLGFPLGGAIGFYLPRYIGQQRATEILLRFQPVSGLKALELGLVNELVTSQDLKQRCVALVEEIGELPVHTIAAMRASLHPNPAELKSYLDRTFDRTLEALAAINREQWQEPRKLQL